MAFILKDTIYGYNYNGSFSTLISNGAQETFFEFYLIKHIFCYLITKILSAILYYYKANKYDPDLSLIIPLK